MSQPCELPPCPPCPPLSPPPCPQVCPPPPPMPPCRVKPIMRGLHWAQTKSTLVQALALSAFAGASYYFLVGRPRRAAYKDYYLMTLDAGHFQPILLENLEGGIYSAVDILQLR